MTRDLLISGFGFGLVVGPIGATVTSRVGHQVDGHRLGAGHRLADGGDGHRVCRCSVPGGCGASTRSRRDINIPIVRPGGLTDAQWQAMQDAAAAAIDQALHTVFSNFFLIAAIIIGLAVIPAFFFYNKRERGDEQDPVPAPLRRGAERLARAQRRPAVRTLG